MNDLRLNYFFHKRAYQSAAIVLSQIDQELPYHDSISSHFANSFITTVFVESVSAYESLKSTGINLVSSKKIRELIIQTYENHYKIVTETQANIEEDILAAHKTIFPFRFREFWTYDFNSPEYTGKVVPLDFESLQDDQEFLYFYRTIANYHKSLAEFVLSNAMQNNENLINNLNQEIAALKK